MPLVRILPVLLIALSMISATLAAAVNTARPHIVLVMSDDMGWGQTGYYNHPVLTTPHLDAMAANGLRFDRFYAGAPNCSPTRATVLTGRSNDRAGVQNHGFALRRQEKTIAQALQKAGYITGHFGKWHLNGFQGPGVPILATDTHHPGHFGFDEWLSVTNFFERDSLLSRQGKFEDHSGDSSDVVVQQALLFMRERKATGKPLFSVIWYGSPHSPYIASAADKAAFAGLDEDSQNHYGELVAMDRSIGTLRKGLRDLGLAENTLLLFCSDNGGLPGITPGPVGTLRGLKNTVFEGGLRVPAIIEWPAAIRSARITQYPAGTIDIFPTIVDILGLPESNLIKPIDGISLKPLFTRELTARAQPLPFRHQGRGAWIDNQYKLLTQNVEKGVFELYDLQADPNETKDLSASQPEVAQRLRTAFLLWNESVKASVAGKDYPEGQVNSGEPKSRRWYNSPEYEPFLEQWKDRPEYRAEILRRKQ